LPLFFSSLFDAGIVRELPLDIRCRQLTCERGSFAASSSPRHSPPTPAVPVGRDPVALVQLSKETTRLLPRADGQRAAVLQTPFWRARRTSLRARRTFKG